MEDILDFAIQMEQDGYAFYIKAAQSLEDKAARRMLEELARDEKEHEKILQDMKAGGDMTVRTSLSEDVRNIFQELADSGEAFIDPNGNLADVLRQGILIEQKSIERYFGFAQIASDPDESVLWQQLQAIEEKHEKLLALTLEHLSQPRIVLETAEFLFYDHDAP